MKLVRMRLFKDQTFHAGPHKMRVSFTPDRSIVSHAAGGCGKVTLNIGRYPTCPRCRAILKTQEAA